MALVLEMVGVEAVGFNEDENMQCFGPMFSHYSLISFCSIIIYIKCLISRFERWGCHLGGVPQSAGSVPSSVSGVGSAI